MSSILKCQGLSKAFGHTNALTGFSLSLEPGRIVGLLGPNGSGKTTLLKLANGLLTPTAGEILIAGMKPGIGTKKVISYLPEKTYLNDWMKVHQIIGRDCKIPF